MAEFPEAGSMLVLSEPVRCACEACPVDRVPGRRFGGVRAVCCDSHVLGLFLNVVTGPGAECPCVGTVGATFVVIVESRFPVRWFWISRRSGGVRVDVWTLSAPFVSSFVFAVAQLGHQLEHESCHGLSQSFAVGLCPGLDLNVLSSAF